jgi:hypothetical protein
VGTSVLFKDCASRESIMSLQAHLSGMEQIDCPVKHYHAPNLYAREIFMPKGAVVVGKIHKHAHVNNISKGSVIVSTEFGNEQYDAPCQFVSKAGTKRAVLVLEDCIWTTYHPTSETELEKIEDEVIAKSFEDYEQFRLIQEVKFEVLP